MTEQWEIRLWVPPSSVDHTWEPLPHDAWPFAVTHQGIWLRRRVTTPTYASGEQQEALAGQPAQAPRQNQLVGEQELQNVNPGPKYRWVYRP